MDETFVLIKKHLPSNPETAAALATIMMEVMLLLSRGRCTAAVLADLDHVVAGVAFSYRK